MSFFRRSSTPAFIFAAVVFTSTLGLVRDSLFVWIMKEDLAAASEPSAPLDGVATPAVAPAPDQAPSEPPPGLTPEEQREQTIVRVRGALGEEEPLPGAVPISQLEYGDAGSSADAGEGHPGGPDGPGEVGDLHTLQRVGYQPVVQSDPLVEDWVPLAVAVSGGGLVAFLGLIGAVMLLRGHAKPAAPPHEVGGGDSELVSMTPRPGADKGAFTDEDVLKVMRESKR